MNVHSVLPDEEMHLAADFHSVRLPLLLNAALAALRTLPPQALLAVQLTTSALALEGKDGVVLSAADQAKALYRRALGRVATKDDELAEPDLIAAAALVPGDAAIKGELLKVVKRKAERKAKERAAFGKMFA